MGDFNIVDVELALVQNTISTPDLIHDFQIALFGILSPRWQQGGRTMHERLLNH